MTLRRKNRRGPLVAGRAGGAGRGNGPLSRHRGRLVRPGGWRRSRPRPALWEVEVSGEQVRVALAVAGDQAVDPDPARGPPHDQDHDGEQGVEGAHAGGAGHHVGEQQGQAAEGRDAGEQAGDQGDADRELGDGDQDADPPAFGTTKLCRNEPHQE